MKKELCIKLVIYKNYTEMHGQQNMKQYGNMCDITIYWTKQRIFSRSL